MGDTEFIEPHTSYGKPVMIQGRRLMNAAHPGHVLVMTCHGLHVANVLGTTTYSYVGEKQVHHAAGSLLSLLTGRN